jgi:hypothetical protein
MTDGIFVRQGVVEDFNEVMRLSINAATENAIVDPDEMLVAENVYACLTGQHGIIGVIGAEADQPLEGMIILGLGNPWYSHEQTLEEKVVYVAPEFRAAKGGRARKLVEWAKGISESHGIPLTIAVLSNSRTEAKIRLFERAFGAPAGVCFLYNGKTGLKKG